MRVTSADCMAMSVPVPMAMPTSACAKAGASLMPSPTMATSPLGTSAMAATDDCAAAASRDICSCLIQ